jgi:peroxiredoxin
VNKLGIGDTFPNLSMNRVGGGTISLPADIGTKYGVVLFYRGHW